MAYLPQLLSRASATRDLIDFIRTINWESKEDVFSGALRGDEVCLVKAASEGYLKVKTFWNVICISIDRKDSVWTLEKTVLTMSPPIEGRIY